METDVDLRKYELMIMIDPSLGDEGFKTKYAEISDLIRSTGGQIFFEDRVGLRSSAYRIKKQVKGYYAVFGFDLAPDRLRELDHTLKLDPLVVRHLMMVLPKNFELKPMTEYEAEFARSRLAAASKKEKEAKAPRSAGRSDTLLEKVEEELFTSPGKKPPEEQEQPKSPPPPRRGGGVADESDTEKLSKILDNPDINL